VDWDWPHVCPHTEWRRALLLALDDYACPSDETWTDELRAEFFAAHAQRVDHVHNDPCRPCADFVAAALKRVEHDREHQAKYEKYLASKRRP
jgi:hypothetical protein